MHTQRLLYVRGSVPVGRGAVLAARLACYAGLFVVTAAAALAGEPDERVAWLRKHAIPLKTWEAGRGEDDLRPLKAVLGDARIVSLGECTHGTREVFQMKHRLLEFLVTEMGFSIFSIEASMPEAYRLNDFVLHGRGDPEELINGMYFWTWNTEEVRDMVLWMREYNKSGKGRVQFTGFDMQTPDVAMTNVVRFLKDADAERAKAVERCYDRCADGFFNHRYSGGGGAGGFGVAASTFPADAARGRKIRYSGWIKTEGVTDFAGLWWRADGPEGVLAFDNMAARGPKGDSDWQEYAIELDIPAETVNINFGMLMPGGGRAWFDGLNVEIDGKAFDAGDSLDFDFEGEEPRGFITPAAGYTVRATKDAAKTGKQSLCMERTAAADAKPGMEAAEAARLCGEVVRELESQRDAYASKKPAVEVDWAIQNARVVHQCAQMYTNEAGRDESMARNVKWILDQAAPGTKIVLWAHNAHVSRHRMGRFGAMGSFLDDWYGKDHVVIGFAAGEGTYTAIVQGKGLRSDNALSPPPAESFEHYARQVELPIFAVDLRGAAGDGDGAGNADGAWLRAPRPFRSIGAIVLESQFYAEALTKLYDVIIYIDKTSASRLLPRALGRTGKGGGAE